MEPILPSSPLLVGRAAWTRRKWLGTVAMLGLAIGCRRGAVPTGRSIRILVRESFFSDAGHNESRSSEGGLIKRAELVTTDFEQNTGIGVEVDTFASEDELTGRLEAAGAYYDLVMPTDFMVRRLFDQNLLKNFTYAPTPIHRELPLHYQSTTLPNLRHVDSAEFALSTDPTHLFSVPYLWNVTGIGYNVDRVDALPASWMDLFKTQTIGAATKVALLDDSRGTLCTALISMKRSPTTKQVSDIEEAGDLIISLRDRITIMGSEAVQDALRTGRVDMALAWSGDVTGAMRDNPNVRLALPNEGSIKNLHYFVVPRSARNQPDAEMFLNYLLEPQVAAAVSNYSSFASTLPAARPYMDRFITNSAAYFTNPRGSRLDFSLDDTNDMSADFERVWQRVREQLA